MPGLLDSGIEVSRVRAPAVRGHEPEQRNDHRGECEALTSGRGSSSGQPHATIIDSVVNRRSAEAIPGLFTRRWRSTMAKDSEWLRFSPMSGRVSCLGPVKPRSTDGLDGNHVIGFAVS